MNITLSTVDYEITVSSSNSFYTSFNLTSSTLSSLQQLGCFINNFNNGPDYTSIATSSKWTAYVAMSIASAGII
jgi:hypothetical protein